MPIAEEGHIVKSANIFNMPTVSESPSLPDSLPLSHGQTNLTLQQLPNGQIFMSGMCVLHFIKVSHFDLGIVAGSQYFARVLLAPEI